MHCKSLRRKESIDADLSLSFECFPEHDKEYKWRLGLTIVAAVLTHSSSMLVDVTMMRFWNETQWEEERDPIEQDGGSSYEEFDNRSEAQLKGRAERTIMYKTGLGIATVFLSLILTGCFHRNASFPVVCNPLLTLIETES